MGRVIRVMLVACMAGLASYSAMAEPAPRSIRIADDAGSLAKKKPAKAPASCADNKDKHDCVKLGSQEGDCAWCEGQYMPASCMSAMAAKYLPETVAKCKLPKEHKDDAVVVDAATNKKKKPAKAPASCADNKDKHDCVKLGSQEGDCAWCEGQYMPASCMSAMAAKYLPETVAKCKLPKEHKEQAVADAAANKKHKPAKAPASCADNKDKHDCVKLGSQEGDCAWCEGQYMPASCMSAMAAKYLPETVAKCKLPKEHKAVSAESSDDDDKPKAKAPTSCGDNKEKEDCLDLGAQEGDCAWCKGDFMPPSCVGVDAAKWIPETVAHCKVPKGKKGADVTDTVTKMKSDSGDDDDDDDKKDEGKGGDWPSGGGDWPSGGGDWPSGGGSSGGGGDYPYGPGGGSSGGGGDYPYGPGGGSGGGKAGGKGCKELKSRHKCMKGSKSEGACAWCEKSFVVMSGGCVPESMVKWLPKMVADCEVGKDRRKKKDDAVAVA
ncbi:hypothetical protein OEZ85_013030 [Tetradesmus obliquus]|uniref:Uncharacterized protein n=1 Tax=Tetradesmus obliquus TaxID=3088 RepID=A0ABY8U4F4_TETOB|nr:hypothetical protein OEZ85_013030 [Tetradesmus obliquus]